MEFTMGQYDASVFEWDVVYVQNCYLNEGMYFYWRVGTITNPFS